jgi:hypothetical protein
MKCSEIDIIEYIEGRASAESISHVAKCKRCSSESERLREFSELIETHYAEGKKLESNLDRKLQSIDISRMKKMPPTVADRVRELREKSLASKVRDVIGKGKKNAEAFLGSVSAPQMHALPASPKDITKDEEKRREDGRKKTASKSKKRGKKRD